MAGRTGLLTALLAIAAAPSAIVEGDFRLINTTEALIDEDALRAAPDARRAESGDLDPWLEEACR